MEQHLKMAMEAFRRGGDLPAARLQLMGLELAAVPDKDDVPDSLLKRLEEATSSKDALHGSFLILARALRHRFEYKHRDPRVPDSELLGLIVREQKALRKGIRRNPSFTPFYLLLAESYVVNAQRKPRLPDRRGAGDSEALPADYSRAISVLMAVPRPGDQVRDRLALYFEATGQLDKAKVQLELLASLRPSAKVFSRLLMTYVKTGDQSLRVLLAADAEQGGEILVGSKLPEERMKFLSELRRSLERLPECDGLRYTFLALQESSRERVPLGTEAAEARQKRLIGLYTKAVEAYDKHALSVPVVVLNNLSWYLAEDSNQANRSKAVEVAKRAMSLAPNPAQTPDVHDTYAWALYKNGQLLEAKKVLQDLLRAVDRPVLRFHLARVLFDLKEFEDALTEVQKVLRSSGFPEERSARDLELRIREAREKVVGS
jgi:tetratricopeptide (TPR) repeat protein